jgi:hypothetical protein
MKKLLLATALVSLALAPETALAAKKKAAKMSAPCTTGAFCSKDCDKTTGWCSRYVCVGGKWEKRVISCLPPFCGPACS